MRPVFKEYHADGKKTVSKENLVVMMGRLATDECIIGKIPNVTSDEYESLFADWRADDDGLITWH